jgi:hypothetical protein
MDLEPGNKKTQWHVYTRKGEMGKSVSLRVVSFHFMKGIITAIR